MILIGISVIIIQHSLFPMNYFTCLLLQTILTISIPSQPPLHHFTRSLHSMSTKEQKQTYLEVMKNQQIKIKQIVTEMKKIRLKVMSNLVNYHDDMAKIMYDLGYQKLRDKLIETRGKILSLEKLRVWECRKIRQTELNMINTQIRELEDRSQQLKALNLSQCIRDTQINYEFANIQDSLKLFKASLSNNCLISEDMKVLYISNIQNNRLPIKYIYGNSTLEQNDNYLQQISKQNIVVKCPEDMPFVVDNKCVDCQLYNIQEGTCLESCGLLYFYDPHQHQCLKKLLVNNLKTKQKYVVPDKNTHLGTIKHQTKIINNQTVISCPDQRPFVNDLNQCIACDKDQIFNLTTKNCTNCPSNSYYNEDQHLCLPVKKLLTVPSPPIVQQCKKGLIWNGTGCIKCENPGFMKQNICVCPDSYFYHWALLQCRPRTQICLDPIRYWNGTMCMACASPGTFKYKTLICQCPSNYTYNYEVEKCLFGDGKISRVANILNSKNWIYGADGEQKYNENLKKVNLNTTTFECPAGTPFPLQNGECVTCGIGELYDLTMKKCKKCPSLTFFNKSSHQCQNIKVPETVIEQQCQQNFHYWNGTLCIRCQPPGQFHNNVCVCPENLKYIKDQQICSEKPQRYVINYINENWVYGSSNKDQETKVLDQLAKDYKLVKCPEETPFPSTSQLCIICPKGKVFDISSKFCTECRSNQAFNKTSHACEQEMNDGVIICPSEFPFYNGTSCVKCEEPGIWDQLIKTCQCPSKYYYDSLEQRCKEIPTKIKNSNSSALNYYGTMPFSDLLQTCPLLAPFFNGKNCTRCDSPRYFDFTTNVCAQCQNGLVFDISTHSCITIVPSTKEQQYNSLLNKKNTNYCCSAPSFDSQIQSCPPQKPFFNKVKCVSCENPSYFNFLKLVCENCSSGQTFNNIIKQCEVVQGGVIIKYESYISDSIKNYKGIPDSVKEESGVLIKICPTLFPFYDGSFCLSCEPPKYYNYEAKKCQSCQQGYQFSSELQVCSDGSQTVQKFTSYLIQSENYAGQSPDVNPTLKTCPSTTPYFNGKQCEACILPKYFNLTSQKCQQCQKNNSYFNTVQKICLVQQHKHITNIKNTNIFYYGDFQNKIAQYQLKKKGNPFLLDCPSQTPFYVSSEHKCINCPSQTPIFNMNNNGCMKCREDSYFSNTKHSCIGYNISPSIERILMNIL